MGRTFFDRRLQRVTDLPCPRCRRPEARATGTFHAVDRLGWRIELTCDCGDEDMVAPPGDDPRIQRALRERDVGDPTIVAGEIGDDGPVRREVPPTATRPAVIRVRETASALARTMRRAFDLDLLADGALIHEDTPMTGASRSMPIRRQVVARDVLPALQALLAASRLATRPPEVGRGEHHATFAWPGADGPRTVRWNQRGTARDIAGDPAIDGPILDLIDGLQTLTCWVDAGGPTPRWPAVDAPAFPRAEDLLAGVQAARLSMTHDWDGAQRCVASEEVWVSASGRLERRTVRAGDPLTVLRASRPRTLPRAEARALFARLTALDPAGFRRALGFVRQTCGLDTTHHHTLDWFDGDRVHRTTLVFGSERGIGTALGDAPPTPDEAAAFRLLSDLQT